MALSKPVRRYMQALAAVTLDEDWPSALAQAILELDDAAKAEGPEGDDG